MTTHVVSQSGFVDKKPLQKDMANEMAASARKMSSEDVAAPAPGSCSGGQLAWFIRLYQC